MTRFTFSSRSRTRAQFVDPALMGVAEDALAISAVDFGFTEDQSRTKAEQQRKFDTGVSKVRPGPKARHMIQADGYSKAIDAVPFVDGKFQWGDPQWRIKTASGAVIEPFYEIAAAMREAAIKRGVRVRWGAVWDRVLNDLPAGAAAMKAAVEAYKVRHVGADFLDGPHFEIVQ